MAEVCAQAGKPVYVIAGKDALDPAPAGGAGIASIEEASTIDAIEEAGRAIAALES